MNAPPFPTAAVEAAREAAKVHLRVSGEGEDAAIGTMAATALALAESFTGRALIVREFADTRDTGRSWRQLEAQPVTSIGVVETVAVDGSAEALAVDRYAIDIDGEGFGWVRLSGVAEARVRVTYTAGLAEDWAGLPAPVAQGVVLLIAHLFVNREAAVAPPAAVAALWRPWRRLALMRREHVA